MGDGNEFRGSHSTSWIQKNEPYISENSHFHLNVTTEFTIITSLGKQFHFLTVISSKNISPISVCICPLPLFYCSLDFFNPFPSQVRYSLKCCSTWNCLCNLNNPCLLAYLLRVSLSYKQTTPRPQNVRFISSFYLQNSIFV